mmetsp:Transcript_98711/g.284841  ORF Transcript_98711/g.284841 Transcript_98711/m.284841 type:complete len:262 (+) Transcript_98711:987-1772(+)
MCDFGRIFSTRSGARGSPGFGLMPSILRRQTTTLPPSPSSCSTESHAKRSKIFSPSSSTSIFSVGGAAAGVDQRVRMPWVRTVITGASPAIARDSRRARRLGADKCCRSFAPGGAKLGCSGLFGSLAVVMASHLGEGGQAVINSAKEVVLAKRVQRSEPTTFPPKDLSPLRDGRAFGVSSKIAQPCLAPPPRPTAGNLIVLEEAGRSECAAGCRLLGVPERLDMCGEATPSMSCGNNVSDIILCPGLGSRSRTNASPPASP